VGYRRADPAEHVTGMVPLVADTGIEVEVVELRLDPAELSSYPDGPALSLYNGHLNELASAGRRALLVVSPFLDNRSRFDPETVGRTINRFCDSHSDSQCIEGILLDTLTGNGTVYGDRTSLTSWIEVLGKELAGHRLYLCIDTNVPLDGFLHLLELMRDACRRGVLAYIVRRASTEYSDTFAYTRYFTAAARLQRWPFVIAATAEPPAVGGAVSAVFETVASGAGGLVLGSGHLADPQIADALAKAATHIRQSEPTPHVAVLWPSVHDLADRSIAERFLDIATAVRTVTDYDVLDEDRIDQGALEGYQVLLLASGCVYARNTLDRIYKWVCDGGILVANCVGRVCCPDGETTFNRDLLDRDVAAPNPKACCTMRRIEQGAALHYSPEIAAEQDESIDPVDGYLRMVASVLRRNLLLGADKIEPDAVVDGVHVARLQDRILLFNATDRLVIQEVLVPRTTRKSTISLPPLEITELRIGDIMADTGK